MPKGFFHGSKLVSKAPPSLIPKCGACGLCTQANSPKMPYSGKGKRGILIVGEFPRMEDDEDGKHFTSEGGQFLRQVLSELGVDMREDCWLTNAIICHPPKGTKKLDEKVDFCRPNLLRTFQTLKPHTVILMGTRAVQSFIGHIWKENPGDIDRWAGWAIPCQKPNVWIHPMQDPSLVVDLKWKQLIERNFRKHLAAAIHHKAPPWKKIPNYRTAVQVVMDEAQAARIMRKMKRKGGNIAGDYENNCLKPEVPGGKILCCSFSWRGRKTIAFPWTGEAAQAARELWHAKNCRFIASNLKHENRWTLKDSGKPVRNWLLDTMLAAHALDNRSGITGLKFQAFVRLGAESYDDHIKKFLGSKEGQRLNRAASEVNIHQLLHYCGMDTLLEYLLALVQIRELNADLDSIDIVESSHFAIQLHGDYNLIAA